MRRLTAKQERAILHVLRVFPLYLERLYYRDYYTSGHYSREEIPRRMHVNMLRGNERVWGQARWRRSGRPYHQQSIHVDLGAHLAAGASMDDVVNTVVHEASHIAFQTYDVVGITERAVRSPSVKRAAERKLLRAIVMKANL